MAVASDFGVRRRAAVKPRRVFRGDTRSPDEVFSSGFSPRGTNEDIGKYALHDKPSNWVGTSKSSSQAGNFPQFARGRGTWVYEIRGNGYGVDVNRALGGATKSFIKGTGFPAEREVIFRGIDGSNIVRAERWQYGRPTGEVIENPRFTNE
ncbi:enterotoxin A family protein [Streptomyces sp. NBC_01775]|nr:enterotoxin A family protein [Streptomyces sp. NBC_01775]